MVQVTNLNQHAVRCFGASPPRSQDDHILKFGARTHRTIQNINLYKDRSWIKFRMTILVVL